MFILLVIFNSGNSDHESLISGSISKYLNKELYDHLANMTYSCYDKLRKKFIKIAIETNG